MPKLCIITPTYEAYHTLIQKSMKLLCTHPQLNQFEFSHLGEITVMSFSPNLTDLPQIEHRHGIFQSACLSNLKLTIDPIYTKNAMLIPNLKDSLIHSWKNFNTTTIHFFSLCKEELTNSLPKSKHCFSHLYSTIFTTQLYYTHNIIKGYIQLFHYQQRVVELLIYSLIIFIAKYGSPDTQLTDNCYKFIDSLTDPLLRKTNVNFQSEC